MTYLECNPYFKKEKYVMLLNKMGIDAQVSGNGVLVNIDQYKANYSEIKVPQLVSMNHRFMKKYY